METTRTPVFHRYKVIEKIGSGGMGTVYKARDEHLDRLVALKVLPPALQEDDAALERFKREARSLAHLNHPRVAAVYDAQAGEGFPYLVMELVEGENLERYLRRRRALSPVEAARIGIDVAEALAHIHHHRIVHRDVKTSNIIMEPEKGAVLADFGIALEASLPRLSQGALGTPEYMSPEQAEGRRLDGRSDLYSLGVVLFECLAGRLPFRRDGDSMASLMDLIQRVTTEPVLPLEVICPDVPRWLCAAVMRCLEKDADERFASAGDFVDALRSGDEAEQGTGLREEHAPDHGPDVRERHVPKYRSDIRAGRTDPVPGARTSARERHGQPASPTSEPNGRPEPPPEPNGQRTAREMTVLTHLEAVQAVACGSNGRLVSGSNDGVVRVWDAREGRLLHALRKHEGSVSAVAFSRDGRFIASGDRLGKICIWDGGTARLLRQFDALSALVLTVAFSPDGTRLVSGGADRAVRLWNVRTGKLAETVGRHQGYVLGAAFAGDGARLATSGSDGQVLVWDVGRRSLSLSIQAHRGWAMAVDFSADGRRLVSGGADRRLCLWHATKGTLLKEIEGHRDAVMTAVFSPSGRYFASSGRDGAVRLWDARSGASAGCLGAHDGASMSIAFSPDGRHVAAGGDDRTVRVWPLDGYGFRPRRQLKRAAAWAAIAILAMASLWGPLDVTEMDLRSSWARLAQSASDVSGWMGSVPPASPRTPVADDVEAAGDRGSHPSSSGTSASSGTSGRSEADARERTTSGERSEARSPSPESKRTTPRAAGPPHAASSERESTDAVRPPPNFHPLYGGGRLVAGVAGWTIEVGRLRNPRGAAFVAEHYRDLGYRAGVLSLRVGEQVEYLVGVGHFADRAEAASTISKLRSRELPYAIHPARLQWDAMVAVR